MQYVVIARANELSQRRGNNNEFEYQGAWAGSERKRSQATANLQYSGGVSKNNDLDNHDDTMRKIMIIT